MRFGRRSMLGVLGALGAAFQARATWAADSGPLELVDVTLPSDKKLARRCLLLVPRATVPKRLLVLCHGLGETVDELAGIHAWAKPYGLLHAYERLLSPPLARTLKARYFTDEHLARLNAELAARPFQGLAIACPFTPNVYKSASGASMALDRYASWMSELLLPELRKRLGLPHEPSLVGLDGVSLGGFVALEVFARRPEQFGAVGCVQGAFGAGVADLYARRLKAAFDQAGSRPVRIATSRDDPYRRANERLAERLKARGADVTLSVTPGPHNQPWLREVASVELLHHYDRLLGAPARPAAVQAG